ncbi:MAG: pentapeptide repeat-containing protein [Nitrospirota bacterium]|nr:pentapeptide repeat-containing protein [Nitrospirota bacterium]
MTTDGNLMEKRPGWEALKSVLAAHRDWVYSEGSRGERADLSGRDLSGMDLSDVVLDRARLVRADLHGADLTGASLRGADLTWCNLKAARLSGADLHEANLAEVDLSGARLKNADFTNADLEGADLRGADISGVRMEGAGLGGALFDNSAPADAAMDAAYEAEDVYDFHASGMVETVSELPDADDEDADTDEDAGPGAEAWVRAVAGEPARPVTSPPGRYAAPSAPAFTPPAAPASAAPEPHRVAMALAPEHRPDALSEQSLWRSRVRITASGQPDFAGADVRGMSLRGADLRQARHLGAHQLAGTDLSGATLPPELEDLSRLTTARATADHARRLFLGVSMACLYTLTVMLENAGHPTFFLSGDTPPGLLEPGPWFFVIMPWLLLGGFLWLHVYLQRLWEAIAALPALFPDGTPVTARVGGWLVGGIAWNHVPRLIGHQPELARLQTLLAGMAVWGLVPGTQALFWGAFAAHASPAAAIWHGLAAGAGCGFAIYSHLLCRRTLRGAG